MLLNEKIIKFVKLTYNGKSFYPSIFFFFNDFWLQKDVCAVR